MTSKIVPVLVELLTVSAVPVSLVKPFTVVVPVIPTVEALCSVIAPAALLPMLVVPVALPVLISTAFAPEEFKVTAPLTVAPALPVSRPVDVNVPAAVVPTPLLPRVMLVAVVVPTLREPLIASTSGEAMFVDACNILATPVPEILKLLLDC